jgi:hypothetical protein
MSCRILSTAFPLQKLLREVPWELILSVDEMQCADFVDARNEPVIVPATYEGDKIAIPVDRNIK